MTTKKLPQFMTEDGKPVTDIKVDGYGFGDRLLEGVYFTGQWNDKAKRYKVIGVVDSSKDYFDGLNKKKWLKAAEDYMNDTDGAEDMDGNFLERERDETPIPLKRINLGNLNDLFGKGK